MRMWWFWDALIGCIILTMSWRWWHVCGVLIISKRNTIHVLLMPECGWWCAVCLGAIDCCFCIFPLPNFSYTLLYA